MQSTKQEAKLHDPKNKIMFPPLGGNLITYRPEGMDQQEYRRIQRNQKKLIKQRKRGWFVHISARFFSPFHNDPTLMTYQIVSGQFKGVTKHLPVL